jgi:hypothetical protein
MRSLTAERVRTLLTYDHTTGVFANLVARGKVKAGDDAGTTMQIGYRCIGIDGRPYYAHRLAWLLVYGEWPKAEIDHIDGNKANNAIVNLRDASKSLNMQNRRTPRADNKSGFLGVSVCKQTGGWRATIRAGGKFIHLGRFDSPQAAADAYSEAKRTHHASVTA